MDIIKEKWEEILYTVKLEHELTDVSFDTWLKPLKVHSFEKNGSANMLYILIPAEQQPAFGYIKKKYALPLRVAIAEITGLDCSLEFILPEEAQKLEAEKATVTSNLNECIEKANLNPKYTFDTFVVGSNNNFAHAASLAVAESPGEMYNPLFIYGGVGLGKTHLMHSIAHFILERNPETKVLYVTSESFTNELIEAIRNNNNTATARFREKYRNIDVLLIDDIQFIIGKESTQEEFFHTFNVLHSAGKQIILSSDKPPKEMETLDERFRSRFEWGLIADIQPPDYETRMAILRKNAETYDKEIDDEIIKYIATNIKSNIRELEGALNKVMANARLNKKELTLALAEDALKDVIYPDQVREITPALIIDVVAEHFNVPKEEITSKKRNSEYVLPRQIIMYLCRNMIDMSQQSIANLLSKKDHTTIIHGIKKIDEKLATDEDLRNKIETIKKKISPS